MESKGSWHQIASFLGFNFWMFQVVTCQGVEFWFQDSRRVPKCRIITNLARMRTCRIIDKECGHVESIKSADMSNNHWIIGFRYTQHSSVRDEYKFVYYILESDPFSFKNLYPREMNLSDFNFTRCILWFLTKTWHFAKVYIFYKSAFFQTGKRLLTWKRYN